MSILYNSLPILQERLEGEDISFSYTGATWDDFEKFYSEENHGYRLSFIDGVLTVVSPSRSHEAIARVFDILVAAFCRKYGILYYPMGSTTLTNKPLAGKEPDASYSFGEIKQIPDLAIEVAFSSGGIDDLEKYKLLNVKEVWLWKSSKLRFFVLNEQYSKYEERVHSWYLNNLSSKILVDFINRALTESPLVIEREFQKILD